MAMIKCSECGKDNSSQAEICPHCGKRITASPVTQDMAEVYARRNKEEKQLEKIQGCLIKTFKVSLIIMVVCIILFVVISKLF